MQLPNFATSLQTADASSYKASIIMVQPRGRVNKVLAVPLRFSLPAREGTANVWLMVVIVTAGDERDASVCSICLWCLIEGCQEGVKNMEGNFFSLKFKQTIAFPSSSFIFYNQREIFKMLKNILIICTVNLPVYVPTYQVNYWPISLLSYVYRSIYLFFSRKGHSYICLFLYR